MKSLIQPIRKNAFIWFVFKFICLFCLFYFGSLSIIGLAAKDGLYSPFIDNYFNVIGWISQSLIYGTKGFAWMFGFETYTLPNYVIRIVDGTGVRIAYDCVGYGVLSFWAAFILSTAAFKRVKLKWLIIGLFVLWLINVMRIGGLLIAYNKQWPMPFGIDHHTWFNIFAYGAIFTGMYIFDRKHQILPLAERCITETDTRNIKIKVKQ